MRKLSKRTRRIVAVVELFLTLALIVFFFFPKDLEGALGLGFRREDLERIDVHLSAISVEVSEERDLTLLPGDPAFETVMDLLESRRYTPVYLEDRGSTPVGKLTHLTLVSERGERYLPLLGGALMDITGTDVRDKTFRVRDGAAMQEELLALLLAQD